MYVLRTLGRFSLENTQTDAPVLANQRKALALLALLCANRSPVSRDRLMALLWSESDQARARGSLKQLLHLIRKQIGSDDVIAGLAELRLNRELVTSDIDQFRNAIAAGDDHGAITAYGGPFLDSVFIEGADEFERWASTERQELARQFAESLERLAVSAGANARTDEALVLWRRLQDIDPTNGRIAVGLMAALNAAGDRAAAIRHARAHESLLHNELGAPPEPRVANFAAQLLQQTSGDVKPSDVKPSDVKPSDLKPSDLKPSDLKPAAVRSLHVNADFVPNRTTDNDLPEQIALPGPASRSTPWISQVLRADRAQAGVAKNVRSPDRHRRRYDWRRCCNRVAVRQADVESGQ